MVETELKQTARFLLTEIKHVRQTPALLRQQMEEMEQRLGQLAEQQSVEAAPTAATLEQQLLQLNSSNRRQALRPLVQDLLVETLERLGERQAKVLGDAVGQMTDELRRLEDDLDARIDDAVRAAGGLAQRLAAVEGGGA
eukprot:SAG22_NODE_4578_length_1226_cov_5.331854_2_plen_139_part_01